MPFKVVVGAEAILSKAARFGAVKRFGVSKLMLPGERDQFVQTCGMLPCTNLYSDKFFDVWL